MELISWAPAVAGPVGGPDTHDALVSRLAKGTGEHVMSLLTLKAGARMGELKAASTQCVTIILGTAWLATTTERYRLPIGKGFLVKAGEQYYLGSVDGALAVVVESMTLDVHDDCRMSAADVQVSTVRQLSPPAVSQISPPGWVVWSSADRTSPALSFSFSR